MHAHMLQNVWWSEDSLQALVLFHYVGQRDQTQVVMLDSKRLHQLSHPTADLGFNAFWFETGALQYIAQSGLKLCLPSGIIGMRYHARLLMGFCIA